MKKISQANGSKKQTDVAILISDIINFKAKLIRRDREGQSMLIKDKMHNSAFQFLASMNQIINQMDPTHLQTISPNTKE